MTATRKKGKFRQVLLDAIVVSDLLGIDRFAFQIEILKWGQRGPRKSGTITGAGRSIAYALMFCIPSKAPPLGVLLDWLEEFPEMVVGLKREDVVGAVRAVRERGGWICD